MLYIHLGLILVSHPSSVLKGNEGTWRGSWPLILTPFRKHSFPAFRLMGTSLRSPESGHFVPPKKKKIYRIRTCILPLGTHRANWEKFCHLVYPPGNPCWQLITVKQKHPGLISPHASFKKPGEELAPPPWEGARCCWESLRNRIPG